MITIKAEVKKDYLRKDGTFNVKIRFCHKKKVKRVATNIYVSLHELNEDWTFKANTLKKFEIDLITTRYKLKCDFFIKTHPVYTIEDAINYITSEHNETEIPDFITFAHDWISTSNLKGKKNYKSAINSFSRYLNNEALPFPSFTRSIIEGYAEYLKDKGRDNNGDVAKGNRLCSLYVGSLRHLFKEAQKKFNDYDTNIILIPNDPFRNFTCPKQQATKKRALPIEAIRKIYALPYRSEDTPGYRRYNLAKDCFILSFCLIGMNSVDLFNASEHNGMTITYNRTKTRDRRQDDALMKVEVLPLIRDLVWKHIDLTGKRVFRFYKEYSTAANFNRAINIGLKEIGKEIGISKLEFYAARHSWATIAVNDAGVDKYTVHSALNHIDEAMRVTDIYILRDFKAENKANERVLSLVFDSTNQR